MLVRATAAKVLGSINAGFAAIGDITQRYPVSATNGTVKIACDSLTPFGISSLFISSKNTCFYSLIYLSRDSISTSLIDSY